jgi:hypothetical protein
MMGQGYDDKFDSMESLKGQPPKYCYWAVGQCILNTEWIATHGSGWESIRIEVTRDGEDFPCKEMGVIFKDESGDFPDWIDDLEETDDILSVDELVRLYTQIDGNVLQILHQ